MDRRVNSAPRTGIQFARKKQILIFNLLIITDEKEGEEELAWFGTKRKIIYKPLWKWLLE
jgi:hypothetical protein